MRRAAAGGLPGWIPGAALVVLAICLAVSFPSAEASNRGGRPDRVQPGHAGEITPEKLERWRQKTPEERERIRERYHRWKEMSPEQRERIIERRKRWRELPESERKYLRQRREIYRGAWPGEKMVIDKFYRHWRGLPPPRRHSLKGKFREWRGMPASERDEQLMNWQFYRSLPPDEQKVMQKFLFSDPPARPSPGLPGSRPDAPPRGPVEPGGTSRPPRD